MGDFSFGGRWGIRYGSVSPEEVFLLLQFTGGGLLVMSASKSSNKLSILSDMVERWTSNY